MNTTIVHGIQKVRDFRIGSVAAFLFSLYLQAVPKSGLGLDCTKARLWRIRYSHCQARTSWFHVSALRVIESKQNTYAVGFVALFMFSSCPGSSSSEHAKPVAPPLLNLSVQSCGDMIAMGISPSERVKIMSADRDVLPFHIARPATAGRTVGSKRNWHQVNSASVRIQIKDYCIVC